MAGPNDVINSEQLHSNLYKDILLLYVKLQLTDPDLRAKQNATRSDLKQINLARRCS